MSENTPPTAPNTGIAISLANFRQLVTDYLQRMESNSPFTVADYITLVRLWNTIEFQRLGPTDPLFGRYASTFFPAHVEGMTRSLNALPTKGMALYSRDYDLYLGGKPHPNSQYQLLPEPGADAC